MTRANLRSREAAGRAMTHGLDDLLAPVALALPEAAPGEALWQRIEAAIESEHRPSSGRKVIRREQGWRQYSPDVQIKRLWDRNTFLLRCDPGGVLPPHEHRSFEHCIVIEGDMIVGGETYRAGDYHGIPANVAHGEIRSRTGLLMLVRYQPS